MNAEKTGEERRGEERRGEERKNQTGRGAAWESRAPWGAPADEPKRWLAGRPAQRGGAAEGGGQRRLNCLQRRLNCLLLKFKLSLGLGSLICL